MVDSNHPDRDCRNTEEVDHRALVVHSVRSRHRKPVAEACYNHKYRTADHTYNYVAVVRVVVLQVVVHRYLLHVSEADWVDSR